MKKFVIKGPAKLTGAIDISGSKNSALPILAATLLTDEEVVLRNIPRLKDIETMSRLLRCLGADVVEDYPLIIVRAGRKKKYTAPYGIVKTMRGSFCVLGPLLARLGRAKVSLPGGCVIGVRPVDLHIKGIKALGADIRLDNGYVYAKAKALKGAEVYLGGMFGSSVLATANVMMCAVLAKGRTVIENAACEPEIVDLANVLKKMGAKIKGEGSPWIEIEGVNKLGGAEHEIIPDRIEAGTYIMAAGITNSEIRLKHVNLQHLGAVLDVLSGCDLQIKGGKTIDVIPGGAIKARNIATLPYPGFPTDLQAQFVALMTIANGTSVITERVYPDRFMHVPELNRMGANIKREGPYCVVQGVKELIGAPVMASDLRASAALVIAGLAAKGKTEVHRIYHLERGYENMIEKLRSVGADISEAKE